MCLYSEDIVTHNLWVREQFDQNKVVRIWKGFVAFKPPINM